MEVNMDKYTNALYPDKINDLIDNEGKVKESADIIGKEELQNEYYNKREVDELIQGGGGSGSLYIHRITFSVKGSTQQVCTIEMLSTSNTTIDWTRLFNYINSRPNKEIYVLGEFEATGENLTDVWLTSYCRLYLDSLKIGVQPSAYLSINDNMIYNCQDEYESAFIDNREPYTDDILPLI
jgi:hypothetical protein